LARSLAALPKYANRPPDILRDATALETALLLADEKEWDIIWSAVVANGLPTGDAEIEEFRKIYGR
jgi:hypothetical protein